MGLIRDDFGRITIEERRESFVVHTSYGYTDDGNEHSDALGSFGLYWREHPHPEFLLSDLDDLLAALTDLRASQPTPRRKTGEPLDSPTDARSSSV